MSRLLTAALALANLAFPLALYLGSGRLEPGWLAAGLVALALARAWASRQAFWLAAALGAALLGLASLLGSDGWLPLKLYPVLVNAVLLAVFATSLVRPPSVIERLARLAEPELPAQAVRYTRRVTQVWCGFFAGNGLLALATALWGSTALWALYNGVIAYVLIGLLFGAEWLVRRRVRARVEAGGAHG